MAVSSTSIKGFKLRKSADGDVLNGTLLEFIIKDSATVAIGDAVRINTSGLAVRTASTDTVVMGIVQGIVTQDGMNVFSPRVPSTAIAGATLTPQDTIAVASDNSTNVAKKLKVQLWMDPAGELLYSNVANASGLAVSYLFEYFNVSASNSGQIDVASALNTYGQFQLIGLDPDNDGATTKGLFRIAQPQMTSNFASYGTSAVRAA